MQKIVYNTPFHASNTLNTLEKYAGFLQYTNTNYKYDIQNANTNTIYKCTNFENTSTYFKAYCKANIIFHSYLEVYSFPPIHHWRKSSSSLSWKIRAGSVLRGCHRWHCGKGTPPGVCRLLLPMTLLIAWPVLVTLSPHLLLAHHSPRHSCKIWKFPDFFIPSSWKLCLPFLQFGYLVSPKAGPWNCASAGDVTVW